MLNSYLRQIERELWLKGIGLNRTLSERHEFEDRITAAWCYKLSVKQVVALEIKRSQKDLSHA